jgi:DNA polymerase-4
MANPLRSLIVDFNSYFASVEQLLVPELRGLPIAVVPVDTDSTSCIAASKEAKCFGVKTGTGVREAEQMCPGIKLVESRPEEYVRLHRLLVEAIENCTHIEQVMSIDEAWCELTGKQRERTTAEKVAREMKEAVARVARAESPKGHRTSATDALTCSIGISTNPWLAKVASDMQKPDGLVFIEHSDLPHKLHALELRDFCGIGPSMERRLKECGIRTVERMCGATEKELRNAWQSVEGARVWRMLRGEYVPREAMKKRVIGHSHVLPPELRSDAGGRAVCHRLVQKAAVRLRKAGYCAAGLQLSLRSREGGKWHDEISFTDTQDTLEFLHALDVLWERREMRGTSPKKVGVTFFKLSPGKNSTPMFQALRSDHASLCAAIDKVNLGMGRNKVYFGGAHGALKYTPMRIAFTRIPDPETEG